MEVRPPPASYLSIVTFDISPPDSLFVSLTDLTVTHATSTTLGIFYKERSRFRDNGPSTGSSEILNPDFPSHSRHYGTAAEEVRYPTG